MRSKKRLYYMFLLIAALLYILDWFLNNVWLRILAGITVIVAINVFPTTPNKTEDGLRE